MKQTRTVLGVALLREVTTETSYQEVKIQHSPDRWQRASFEKSKNPKQHELHMQRPWGAKDTDLTGPCGWSPWVIQSMAGKRSTAPDCARPRGHCRMLGFDLQGSRDSQGRF